MITLQTLENTPTNELLNVFNLSFSDYNVPFHLTKEQLENKIKNDDIKLELSVGAFQDKKLVGFILHAFDIKDNQKVIYNAGTGVIPSQRGKKLTTQLYNFILPIFQPLDIDKVILEVITENKTAIKIYQNVGFVVSRKLNCYKGKMNAENNINKYVIKKIETYNWPKLRSFWEFKPSWQNAITAVENLKESNISIGIYDDDLLLGYLIFNQTSMRIQQFAIDKKYRNQGLAKSLFSHLGKNFSAEISIVNIEDSAIETTKFLDNQGLKNYINQYEMELILK